MKSNIFLWWIVVDCFLLASRLQPSAITEVALLNTINHVVQKDTDSCIMYDGVVQNLVNKIMQSGHQDDDAVKLMRVLLEKQASILEKLQHRTIERKSRIRFKINPVEVVVVLLLVGILYGVWSYYWNSSYWELLEKLKDFLQPLFDWLQQLRDLFPSWGSASAGAAESTAKSQGQDYCHNNEQDATDVSARKEEEQEISDCEFSKTAMVAPQTVPVESEKSYDNDHELLLRSGGREQKTCHKMPVNIVENSLPDKNRCDTFFGKPVEKLLTSSASVGASSSHDKPDGNVTSHKSLFFPLSYSAPVFDQKLIKEVKKQQEEIMLLLGLTEVTYVSREEAEATKKQLESMLTLEAYIAYSEYLMNKLDPEV